MKTILLSLTHLEEMDALLDATSFIAKQQSSHVIGYYPIPGPIIIPFAATTMDFPVNDEMTRYYKKKLPDVKAKFNEHMHSNKISHEWIDEKRFDPNFAEAIRKKGRETDLIILGHDLRDKKESKDEIKSIYDIVLGAGRPVLIVPLISKRPFKLDNVAVAWNASREASRAAFDSIPLLIQAKNVQLLWVNPEKSPNKAGKLPGADLASVLARHGPNIMTKGLANRNKTQLALVNYTQEDNIDLLVMGAYGHSRLREQVFGGVTEHILRTLPCPVLMSN